MASKPSYDTLATWLRMRRFVPLGTFWPNVLVESYSLCISMLEDWYEYQCNLFRQVVQLVFSPRKKAPIEEVIGTIY